jgi:hypothetical protein
MARRELFNRPPLSDSCFNGEAPGAGRSGLLHLPQVASGELDGRSTQVFLQTVRLGGSWNRHYPRPLGEEPGEGDRRGGRPLLPGNAGDEVGDGPRIHFSPSEPMQGV